MMHVHPHAALADTLPFVMRDTLAAPGGLLRAGIP